LSVGAAVWCATIACGSKLVVGDDPDGSGGGGGVSDASYDYTGANLEGWTENAADCPPEPPQDLQTCTVAEGQFCAYQWTDVSSGRFVHSSCGCWEASSTGRQWSCRLSQSSYPCPMTQPTHASVCSGQVGVDCWYPARTSCACQQNEAADPTWTCAEYVGSPVAPPPSSVDPAKPITDLTDPERQTLCQWLVTAISPPDSPEPAALPPNSDGYTEGTGFVVGTKFYCAGCIPRIPVSYCAANLAFSTCSAPVSELTDCVTTIVDACFPASHGCARYLEKPGCSGTNLVAYEPDGSAGGPGQSCAIKVQ
jgi:hypothetical protein